MSIIGILSRNLFAGGAAQNSQSTQNSQGNPSRFQQIKAEFQQLGQDLQSGNLTQAQSDFATLSKDFPGATQANAAGTTSTTATSTTGTNSVLQEFAQLGQDLQSGNLQAAQQDYTNIQQTAQQNGTQQAGVHHHHGHHHRAEGSESGSSASSQQSNAINQAFGTLAQDLQAGNLSGAQTAFATLQNDLQQIGGFLSSGSNGASATSSPTSTGNLSVSA